MKKILIGVCVLSSLVIAKPRISWEGVSPYEYDGIKQAKVRTVRLIGIDSKSKKVFDLTFNSEIYHIFFLENEIRVKTFRGKTIGFINIDSCKFLRVLGE